MRELNEKEEQIYRAIVYFIEDHSYSPSFRELCEITRFKSTDSISDYLKSMKEKGYITYEPKLSRTIKIIKELERK